MRPSLATTVLTIGGILFAASQTMVVPLLPAIADDTGASVAELSWLITGPLVVAAAVAPALGRLADLYGKKRILLVVMGGMTAGALLAGLTSWIPLLIAGRCLQGIGGAFVPVAISLLRDTLPARKFAGGVAALSSSLGLGVALGVPIAAAVGDLVDWHMVFLALAALNAASGVSMAFIREGLRAPGRRFDVIGAITLTAILAVLMIVITGTGQWQLHDIRVLGGTAFVIVAGALWVWHERRAPEPVVDLRLAMRMPVALTNIAAFFLGYGLFANILLTTQLLQVPARYPWGFGMTLLEAGLLIAPAGVAIVVFARISARFTNRLGPRVTMLIGSAVLAVGYALHLTLPEVWGAVTSLVVASSGLAIAYAALPVLISLEVPTSATASANAINVLVRTAGQAACSAVSAAFLLSFTVPGSQQPAEIGYDLGFLAAMIASALAFGVALFLPRRAGQYS